MVKQTNTMMMMMLQMHTLPPNFGQTTRKERKQLHRIVIKTTQFLSLQQEKYRARHFVLTRNHTNTNTHTYGSQENNQRVKIWWKQIGCRWWRKLKQNTERKVHSHWVPPNWSKQSTPAAECRVEVLPPPPPPHRFHPHRQQSWSQWRGPIQ